MARFDVGGESLPLRELHHGQTLVEDEYGYVDPCGHSRKISKDLMMQLPSHQLDSVESNVCSLPSSSTLHHKKSLKRSETLYRTMKLKRVTLNSPNVDSNVNKIFEILTSDPDLEQEKIRTNLREMHQSLTLKRMVKARIDKEQKNRNLLSTLSLITRFQCRIHALRSKLAYHLKDLSYSAELWQSCIKKIQGHSGSGVASYFIFLRWLLYLNIFNCILSFGFIVCPQMIYQKLGNFSLPKNTDKVTFSGYDLLTGSDWLSTTALYYGHYTDQFIEVVPGYQYNLPLAYLLTACFSGIINLIVLSYSVAITYKANYVYSSGEVKAKLCTRLFCAWDFSVETVTAANLRHRLIYDDLKVLLSPHTRKESDSSFWLTSMKVVVCVGINILIISTTIATGYLVHYILENKALEVNDEILGKMTLALTVTAICFGFHYLISYMTKLEFFFSKQIHLYLTLGRVAVLRIVILGILVYFWIFIPAPGSTQTQCYESQLGEEIYRLIVVNFLMSFVICTLFGECLRSLCSRFLCKSKPAISLPEFDVAYNTNDLIYFQTLVWIGTIYSPMLPLMFIIILIILFYLKLNSAIFNCSPLRRHWPATQSHTVFLVLSLLNFLLTVVTIGYIILNVKPSLNCGPFKGQDTMYSALSSLFTTPKKKEVALKVVVEFIRSPAMLFTLVLALSVAVYYARSHCLAQDELVKLIRERLISESKDKVFLLRLFEKAYQEEIKRKETEDASKGDLNPLSAHTIVNDGYKDYSSSSIIERHSPPPAPRKYSHGYLLADVPSNQEAIHHMQGRKPRIRFENEEISSRSRSASLENISSDNSLNGASFIPRPMHKQGFQYLVHPDDNNQIQSCQSDS